LRALLALGHGGLDGVGELLALRQPMPDLAGASIFKMREVSRRKTMQVLAD